MSMRSATPEILGQTTGWFATRNERRTRQVEWCCNMHIRARKKCVTSKNGQNNLKEFGQANHLSSKYCFFFLFVTSERVSENLELNSVQVLKSMLGQRGCWASSAASPSDESPVVPPTPCAKGSSVPIATTLLSKSEPSTGQGTPCLIKVNICNLRSWCNIKPERVLK